MGLDGAPATTLADLARRTGGRVEGDPGTGVTGMTHDSRRVEPGDLFAAVEGFELDGHDFVEAAVENGARAVMVSRIARGAVPARWPVPALVVESVRAAMGPAAHAIYADPSREMTVVGITGTNGKTTTAFLTAAALETRWETATLGTLGVRRGERATETAFTTPEAPDLARLLRELADDGVEAISMEVSSHAIALGRAEGIAFDAGVFTNLSPEHLDFHGSLEAYGETKLELFRRLRQLDALGVVNADDPWGERFVEEGPERLWRFSLEDPSAEVFAERLELERDETRLTMRTPSGRIESRLALPGRFNAANALAAAAVGVGLGADPGEVGDSLGSVERVPGRFEVRRGNGVTVVVDYAHTPVAFERILRTVREVGPRRLFCVFGCGGERDRRNRPEMGRIAGELAEVVFLTTDNPRREPLEEIMADVREGLEGTSARWERIDDRRTAIRRAIQEEAEPGDVVCLLGKGDESYQWIGEEKLPWSDLEEAEKALASRGRAA